MEKLKLTKIPLEDLIEILHAVYEQGADFVDITCYIDPDNIKDSIEVTYKDSYITKKSPMTWFPVSTDKDKLN